MYAVADRTELYIHVQYIHIYILDTQLLFKTGGNLNDDDEINDEMY